MSKCGTSKPTGSNLKNVTRHSNRGSQNDLAARALRRQLTARFSSSSRRPLIFMNSSWLLRQKSKLLSLCRSASSLTSSLCSFSSTRIWEDSSELYHIIVGLNFKLHHFLHTSLLYVNNLSKICLQALIARK